MKKSRTIASLVLNILALIPLAFVFLNIVLAHLDLQWIGGFWPGFEALGQRRYLLYLLIYVANGFLGLALIGRIILDICQLAKPMIKGKFWAFFKDASTVAVVTGVVFTFVMDLCYDSPLVNLVWTDPLNNVMMIMAIAPVLALVSGLFTEFDHKTPFLLTVLLPFPVYLWVIANAVFGAIGWGGNLGFHGYEIFNPAVTPVWETALLSVAIAAAGYLIGVLYWLVQAGLRKATEPKPSLIVEEVKPTEPAPETPTEDKPAAEETAAPATAADEKAPEAEEEATPITASSGEEPVAPAKPRVILLRKTPKELADAYREEPLPRRPATIVSTRAAKNPTTGTMAPAKETPAPVIEEEKEVEALSEAAPNPESASAAPKKDVATYNNRPRVYHVSKQSDSGKWQVKLATGVKAIRLFDTQEEAIAYAKGLVKTMGGSIRVHSVKGKMRKH